MELIIIKHKFIKAGYPKKFVEAVVRKFVDPPAQEEEDVPLIPEYFFEDPKPFVLVELPSVQKMNVYRNILFRNLRDS